MENSRNKHFIRLKLRTILSSVIKSRAILLCPARDHQPATWSSAPDTRLSTSSKLNDPRSPKADALPSDASRRLTVAYVMMLMSFTSLHLITHFIILHSHKKSEYSTIKYFERERERQPCSLTSITIYCYNSYFISSCYYCG